MADLIINNIVKSNQVTTLIIKDTVETEVNHTSQSSLIGKDCEVPLGVGFVQALSGRYHLEGGIVIVVASDGTLSSVEFLLWLWVKTNLTKGLFLSYLPASDTHISDLQHIIVGADLDVDNLPKIGLVSGDVAYNEIKKNWQDLVGYLNFRTLAARGGETHYVSTISKKHLSYIPALASSLGLTEGTDFYIWSGHIPETAFV